MSFLRFRNSTRRAILGAAAALGVAVAASALHAHDFWVIPDVFAVEGNGVVYASGRSGLRFPNGSAVQAARVSDARLIGERGETKITELSVEGGSLRLQQKPTSPGRYLIAVALTPRTSRSTGAGMLRFLRAEGGAAEADRLERDNLVVPTDSVEYQSTSYGSATVQVGRASGRGFSARTGFPVEFELLNDPAGLRVGDTLHVRILGAGKPIPNARIDAAAAADSAAGETRPAALAIVTADGNGVAHISLHAPGPWSSSSSAMRPS